MNSIIQNEIIKIKTIAETNVLHGNACEIEVRTFCQAYIGLLLSAGLYKPNENIITICCRTKNLVKMHFMQPFPHEQFTTNPEVICFNNKPTRQEGRCTDTLAARDVNSNEKTDRYSTKNILFM